MLSKKTYKYLFFDLDRTLWDFDANSHDALVDILTEHNLMDTVGGIEGFMKKYSVINGRMWRKYYLGNITKNELKWKRFYVTLEKFGITDEPLAYKINEQYLSLCPLKTKVFPGTHETLQHLKDKGYKMYIITNGFNEVQFDKIKNCDIEKYFISMITSENAGAQKPNPHIFHHAITSAQASKNECLMIGDDTQTDIKGANNFGIDSVFFNPGRQVYEDKATYTINDLSDLTKIL